VGFLNIEYELEALTSFELIKINNMNIKENNIIKNLFRSFIKQAPF